MLVFHRRRISVSASPKFHHDWNCFQMRPCRGWSACIARLVIWYSVNLTASKASSRWENCFLHQWGHERSHDVHHSSNHPVIDNGLNKTPQVSKRLISRFGCKTVQTQNLRKSTCSDLRLHLFSSSRNLDSERVFYLLALDGHHAPFVSWEIHTSFLPYLIHLTLECLGDTFSPNDIFR